MNKIYSFSAKTEGDKFEVALLKAKCEKEGMNFSKIIVQLIAEYNERTKNDQRRA